MAPPSTLKGLRAEISFETDAASREISIEFTSELENIRQIQCKINEIITEKIAELKAENKLVEAAGIDQDDDVSGDEE